MKNESIYKKILVVSFPLIIQGVVFQLQSLTDKIFLGRLDTGFVSAVGTAQMPFNAIADTLVAITIGVTILVSHYFGEKRNDSIFALAKSSIIFHSLFGILFFCLWQFFPHTILSFFHIDASIVSYALSYVKICSWYFIVLAFDAVIQNTFQGMGKTNILMYESIIKVFLNIILSYYFIYGPPKMNVQGAAWGTVLANYISFAFIFICWQKEKIAQKWNLLKKEKVLDFYPYIQVVKLGLPIGIEFLLWHISNLILIRFINDFSYVHMAIYSFTSAIQCIFLVVYKGIAQGTIPLIGQSLGQKNTELCKIYYKKAFILTSIIVVLSGLLIFVFPTFFLQFFTKDKALILQGLTFIRWLPFIMLGQNINVLCGNVLRAYGNTTFSLYLQILGSTVTISLSYIFIFKLNMDMNAIYLTVFIDEGIRGIINFFYCKKYTNKKQ